MPSFLARSPETCPPLHLWAAPGSVCLSPEAACQPVSLPDTWVESAALSPADAQQADVSVAPAADVAETGCSQASAPEVPPFLGSGVFLVLEMSDCLLC